MMMEGWPQHQLLLLLLVLLLLKLNSISAAVAATTTAVAAAAAGAADAAIAAAAAATAASGFLLPLRWPATCVARQHSSGRPTGTEVSACIRVTLASSRALSTLASLHLLHMLPRCPH